MSLGELVKKDGIVNNSQLKGVFRFGMKRSYFVVLTGVIKLVVENFPEILGVDLFLAF